MNITTSNFEAIQVAEREADGPRGGRRRPGRRAAAAARVRAADGRRPRGRRLRGQLGE